MSPESGGGPDQKDGEEQAVVHAGYEGKGGRDSKGQPVPFGGSATKLLNRCQGPKNGPKRGKLRDS